MCLPNDDKILKSFEEFYNEMFSDCSIWHIKTFPSGVYASECRGNIKIFKRRQKCALHQIFAFHVCAMFFFTRNRPFFAITQRVRLGEMWMKRPQTAIIYYHDLFLTLSIHKKRAMYQLNLERCLPLWSIHLYFSHLWIVLCVCL